MSNSKKSSIISIKHLIYIVFLAILGLAYKIYTLTGTPFGWIAADLEEEKIDYVLAGLAIFKFVLIAKGVFDVIVIWMRESGKSF